MRDALPRVRRAFPAIFTVFLLGGLAAALILEPVDAIVQAMLRQGAIEESLRLLLLTPVAVTVIVFLRAMVGLDTFGVFAPMMLALAFNKVGLVLGLAVFGALLLIGTPCRLLLERFPALAVARTGVIICLVTLILLGLSFFTSAQGELGLLRAQGVPLVIMAGIIDRFVTAQMDQSTQEATRLSGFTIVSAVLVWLVITAGPLRDVLHTNPDLVLLSFPACWFMGRYTGLRLTELVRFREVARHEIHQ